MTEHLRWLVLNVLNVLIFRGAEYFWRLKESKKAVSNDAYTNVSPLNIALSDKAKWEMVSKRSIKTNEWQNLERHNLNSLNVAPILLLLVLLWQINRNSVNKVEKNYKAVSLYAFRIGPNYSVFKIKKNGNL